MHLKLYEIDGAIQQILDRCTVNVETGEVDEFGFRPDLDAALDALEYERGKIALHLAAKVKEYESFAEAVDSEAKRLRERAGVLNRRAARLRDYIASNIRVGEKYEDQRVQIGWRKSTAVLIRDENALAECFWRVTRAPDLTAIRKELKEGVGEVPGAELETRNHLAIK